MATRNFPTVLIADDISFETVSDGERLSEGARLYKGPGEPFKFIEEQGGVLIHGPIPEGYSPESPGAVVFSYQPNLKPSEITKAVGGGQFDGIIVAAKAVNPVEGKAVIDGAPFLKFAVRIGAGTNNVQSVGDAGGLVMNTPGFNSLPTARANVYALNLATTPDKLARSKNGYDPTDLYMQTREVIKTYNGKGDIVVTSDDLSRYYHGETLEYYGNIQSGMRIAIIGMGHIGGQTAQMLKGQGNTIVAHSGKSFTPEMAEKLGYIYALDPVSAARGADVLLVQTPLNEATRGIISADVIAVAADGFILMNPGRGELVDKNAMMAGTKSLKIGGIIADLDYFPDRPSPLDPYLEAAEHIRDWRKLILTPHTYADTHGPSREEGAVQAIRQTFRAIHVLRGEDLPLINAVTAPANIARVKEDGLDPAHKASLQALRLREVSNLQTFAPNSAQR